MFGSFWWMNVCIVLAISVVFLPIMEYQKALQIVSWCISSLCISGILIVIFMILVTGIDALYEKITGKCLG
jgi:hypothetical protein